MERITLPLETTNDPTYITLVLQLKNVIENDPAKLQTCINKLK